MKKNTLWSTLWNKFNDLIIMQFIYNQNVYISETLNLL